MALARDAKRQKDAAAGRSPTEQLAKPLDLDATQPRGLDDPEKKCC